MADNDNAALRTTMRDSTATGAQIALFILYIYTVIHKKTWQYICDHNTGKTRLIFFYNFCTAVSRKNTLHKREKICSPHLNNVLTLPCENETSHFILNALFEYYPLHQAWCEI